eukprot:gene7332-10893_t
MFGDDEEDDAESTGFKINTAFAARLTHNKQREEKHRLQEKYGENPDETDSESSDDSDADLLDAETEKDFFITLSKLKTNDPEIYNKEKSFFKKTKEELDAGAAAKKKAAGMAGDSKSAKPFSLKDHERKRLQTKGVNAFVSDDEDDEDAPPLPGSRSLRSKTTEEEEEEDNDYASWLQNSESLKDEGTKEEMEPLRRFWTSKDLSHNDKFLRDYITGKQWKSDDSVPTYSQITGSSGVSRHPDDGGGGGVGSHPMEHQAIDMEGLDEEVEAMEAHERKMNFRFEEDGATEIQTYPRTIGDSVRRKDTKRQAARERAKVRKGEEKQQKQEEIARLKKIKQSEIIAKLAEIKAITGTEVEGLEGVDLEGEFDPAEHDKQMEGMFDDQYYGAGEDEGEKPEFPDDLGDIEEEYGADEEYGGEEDWFPNADDGNDDAFPDADAMDADFQQGAGAEAGAVPAPKKLSRKQLKQIEAALERGEHDEEIEKDPMLKRYMDEFYNLDYEDIVGGIPTRFKYREVLPNDFGLTVDEVLKADDQELNNWANLKRMVQFRDDTIERRDKRVYKKRRGAMTAKKTTFAKSEAWKSGIKADEWEQRDAERKASKETKETDRKQSVIEKRLKKKAKRQAQEAVDDPDGVKAAAKAAAAQAAADALGQMNHRDRRKAERKAAAAGLPPPDFAAMAAAAAAGAEAPVKKKRKKSGKGPLLAGASANGDGDGKDDTAADADVDGKARKKAKVAEKAAPTISAERLAAYANAGKAKKKKATPSGFVKKEKKKDKKEKKKKKEKSESN